MINFRRYFRIEVPVIVAALVFVLAFKVGMSALERTQTDSFSEDLAVREAYRIAHGEHSYGIVEYTHYPNGPQYVLALMMKGGITDRRQLRWAPLVFSAFCLALLGYAVCIAGANVPLSAFGIVGVGTMLVQPGIAEWMGALYGNAYSLAICMAGLAICLLPKCSNWVVLALGFLSGWMGYDFTFCFLGSVVVGRLLAVATVNTSFRDIAKSLCLTGGFASLGVGVAIGTHFIQNAIFFGSIKTAFNDLIGSAAARAGLPVASTLNPAYADFIRSAALGQGRGANGEYPRFSVLADLWESFVLPKWSNYEWLVGIMYAVVTVNVCLLIVGRVHFKSWKFGIRPTLFALLGVSVSVLSGVLWVVLMPEHARFHFHFIQRQLFVPVFLTWIVLWGLCNHSWREIRGSNRPTGLS